MGRHEACSESLWSTTETIDVLDMNNGRSFSSVMYNVPISGRAEVESVDCRTCKLASVLLYQFNPKHLNISASHARRLG